MTLPLYAEIDRLKARIAELEHDLDTITVKDSELFQRLELKGRIKLMTADRDYWRKRFNEGVK